MLSFRACVTAAQVMNRQRMCWRRLVHRARAWSEAPDPEQAEIVAIAAGGVFALAICNARHAVRWLFARRDAAASARRPRTTASVRGVVVGPVRPSGDPATSAACIVAGRRRWWRRTRRGYLTAGLHVSRLDERGIITVPRGPIAIVGRTVRSRSRTGGSPSLQLAIGDRVEIRAVFLSAPYDGAPYRGMPASVAGGTAELRVVG
jgi:hypothetical protein